MKKVFKIATIGLVVALLSSVVSIVTYEYWEANRKTSEEAVYSIPETAKEVFKNTDCQFTANRQIGPAPDLIPAAERSVHSVVHIKIEGEQQVQERYVDPFEFFFGGGDGFNRPSRKPIVGYGSGVIISSDGYIITNNHVIDNARKIEVTLNDNRTFKANLIGADPATDIALLKVEGKDLPVIAFGNSDDLKLGEWVLAVGNPFNLTSTVTAGIVSAKARSAGQMSGKDPKIGGFIQTDAAVNPGNSGGALVNAKGELVGINTMIYSQTGNFTGYSFAVPVNTAAKVVADIKKYGSVQRAVLGVVGTDITSELKKKYELSVTEGVFIVGFAERSAAFSAGLDKEDVIIAVDGHKVRSMASLQELINRHRPGDKVVLTFNRKGTEKHISVILKNIEGGDNVIKESAQDILGLTLKELTNEQKRSYGVSYGIAVEKVAKGKLRAEGLRRGFILLTINNTPIQTVAEVRRLVTQSKQRLRKGSLVFRGFYPNGRMESYVVELP